MSWVVKCMQLCVDPKIDWFPLLRYLPYQCLGKIYYKRLNFNVYVCLKCFETRKMIHVNENRIMNVDINQTGWIKYIDNCLLMVNVLSQAIAICHWLEWDYMWGRHFKQHMNNELKITDVFGATVLHLNVSILNCISTL